MKATIFLGLLLPTLLAGCATTHTTIECAKGEEHTQRSYPTAPVLKDGCKIKIEHKGQITEQFAEDAKKLLEATRQ